MKGTVAPLGALAWWLGLGWGGGWMDSSPARGHDIPAARVDRSTQAILEPGRLILLYEVSLAELTLTQDLRGLIGTLPGGGRNDWFQRYGEVIGPLNARGFLVKVDRRIVPLRVVSFLLTVEDHPRYVFRFEADLPVSGRLLIHDTNYLASEGLSQMALQATPGVIYREEGPPENVGAIPERSPALLNDEEDRASPRLEVHYQTIPPTRVASHATNDVPSVPPTERAIAGTALSQAKPPSLERPEPASAKSAAAPKPSIAKESLSQLLEGPRRGWGLAGLLAIALVLGAAHAFQPGHGKTLVAAVTLGRGGGLGHGLALAGSATVSHMLGVLAIALILGLTRTQRYDAINSAIVWSSGLVLAVIGGWRLGRHLAGHDEHRQRFGVQDSRRERMAISRDGSRPPRRLGWRSTIALGFVGGVTPCWDAVLLVVMAEALGRLTLGLALLAAFSLGMGGLLTGVALVMGWLRDRFVAAQTHPSQAVLLTSDRATPLRCFEFELTNAGWERRLGLTSAIILLVLGIGLCRASGV